MTILHKTSSIDTKAIDAYNKARELILNRAYLEDEYAKARDDQDRREIRTEMEAKERELALKTIKFWRANPATSALWYYYPGKKKKCKSKFWGSFCGKYKNHCFYEPPSKKTCGL